MIRYTTPVTDAVSQFSPERPMVLGYFWSKYILKVKKNPNKNHNDIEEPDLLAIFILLHIVELHKNIVKLNELTFQPEIIYKQFKDEHLQLNYQTLSDSLGFDKDLIKQAIKNLEELQLISKYFKTLTINNVKLPNVMFIKLDYENLALISRSEFYEQTISLNRKQKIESLKKYNLLKINTLGNSINFNDNDKNDLQHNVLKINKLTQNDIILNDDNDKNDLQHNVLKINKLTQNDKVDKKYNALRINKLTQKIEGVYPILGYIPHFAPYIYNKTINIKQELDKQALLNFLVYTHAYVGGTNLSLFEFIQIINYDCLIKLFADNGQDLRRVFDKFCMFNKHHRFYANKWAEKLYDFFNNEKDKSSLIMFSKLKTFNPMSKFKDAAQTKTLSIIFDVLEPHTYDFESPMQTILKKFKKFIANT